ncbi:hypothetical protein [Halococcoides cellulosivorans]|uniref:Uncharacterized protein n=1 Tax=Halococcoides cellulosivorans TaxID=1679096 RepID=A0A2R4X134_9EURY|nr:hypothetical protein [Halococcoides cellulosivorans]AWB27491.1 hypothetical protein HARCEL1_07105 [Halococcoides cellulosivorans]
MQRSATDRGGIVRSTRRNALVAWLLVGIIAVIAAGSLVAGDPLWAGFAATVAVLAAVPAIVTREPTAMIPAEVIAVAALPVLGRSLGVDATLTAVATYLSVAAVALIVAVELHAFTRVEMNVAFAMLFVVVTTLAVAGWWAVARWLSDLYLGTALLGDPALSADAHEAALMWEFVASALAGLVAGLLFVPYLGSRWSRGDRQ